MAIPGRKNTRKCFSNELIGKRANAAKAFATTRACEISPNINYGPVAIRLKSTMGLWEFA